MPCSPSPDFTPGGETPARPALRKKGLISDLLESTTLKEMKAKPGTRIGFLALAISVGMFLIWFIINARVGVPEDRTPFVAVWVVAVILGISAFVRGTRWYGGVAAVLGILIGVFLPLTIAVSKQGLAADAIAVGDPLPQFEAIDEFGDSKPFGQSLIGAGSRS